MVSLRRLKVVLMASVALTLGGIGSSQDTKPTLIPPSAMAVPDLVPAGAVVSEAQASRTEELRKRYLELQTELAQHKATFHAEMARHMTEQQFVTANAAARAEITATMQQSQKAVRERNARQELTRASQALRTVAREHRGTEAGDKAQAAVEAIDKPAGAKK